MSLISSFEEPVTKQVGRRYAISRTLALHFLGEFRVLYDGQPLVSLVSPRLQSLLAYLVLHRDAPQSRRYLAFLFWPDSSESQAHANLRYLLYSLRQALPDADCFVHADTQTLQWLPDSPFVADTAAFEAAAAGASDSASLRSAADLYPGPLLPDCYDDWIQPERERLQERFAVVLEQLIGNLEQENDLRSAILYARRLLSLDPLREETYRLLMRFYAKSGDRVNLQRVYLNCVNVLKHELNVEVSAATRTAYEQLFRMEAAPAPPIEPPRQARSNNLPIPLTNFIGRESQVAELQQALLQRSDPQNLNRLITLTGIGGSGKTRLAVEVARKCVDSFKDGVWLIEFASLSDPLLVPQITATILGLREQKERSLTETLVDSLEAKETLLILDNCEHLLHACAQLTELLIQACPRVQILATSRERLNVPGERVFLVPPLLLPDQGDLEPFKALKETEAIRLFVERAVSALPTFSLTRQNAGTVVQICLRVDGLPLAIELAAARVSLLTVEQIADRLQDRFGLLVGGSRTALPRYQTLRASIDWSYDLLSDAEKTILARMSVFSGTSNLEAAEAICSDHIGATAIESVLDLLSHLVEKSFIVAQRQVETRFLMLETIRQYSAEKLRAAGEETDFRTRHCDYYLALAEAVEPKLFGPQQRAGFDQLEAEHDNLRASLQWAQETGRVEAELRLVTSLAWFWWIRGYYSEGRRWINSALAKVGNDFLPLQVKALQGLGHILYAQGEPEQAAQIYDQSLALGYQLGDKDSMLWSLACRGLMASSQGNAEDAKAWYEKGMSLRPEVEDNWHVAWLLAVFGNFLVHHGNISRGAELIEESMALRRHLQNPWVTGITFINVARLARSHGNHARANQFICMCLKLRRDIGDRLGIAICLEEFAEIAENAGQMERAVRLFGAGKTFYEFIGDFTALTDYPLLKDLLRNENSAGQHNNDLAAAWAEGRAMTMEQAIEYALAMDG